MNAPTKPAPSLSRQRLVDLMHDLNHGRISDLEVVDGEPALDPLPNVSRLIVFGKQNGPNTADNTLAVKQQVAELFSIFDRKRSFTIQELVVADGLPGRMTIAETVRA